MPLQMAAERDADPGAGQWLSLCSPVRGSGVNQRRSVPSGPSGVLQRGVGPPVGVGTRSRLSAQTFVDDASPFSGHTGGDARHRAKSVARSDERGEIVHHHLLPHPQPEMTRAHASADVS